MCSAFRGIDLWKGLRRDDPIPFDLERSDLGGGNVDPNAGFVNFEGRYYTLESLAGMWRFEVDVLTELEGEFVTSEG